VNIQPEKIEEISYVSPPQMHKIPDVKPKLEHFTGHVQSLSIRPIEIPDIKPQRREKKFTCYLCQKGVGTKGGLLYHMKAHLNGRPFKCKICKRSYSTKNDFDTHNKRHAGTKFTCDFCNRNFATKQYLADHISALHLPKVLKCHFCKEDRYFSAVKALKAHQLQGHLVASMSGQNNIYSCTMGCGYRTASRQSFELHELHAKQMKFKCITCLQIFSCRKLLFAHMKTEKKSLVECKICKGSFKDIRYHMTKFHSKSNICDFCNFETKCATMFSNHIRQCASQDMLRSRGHLCIECKIYFYSELSLLSHVSKKHGTIFCSICPARFNQKRAHTNHMKMHKQNPIRCLCPKFPMFPNMRAFHSHFNPVHRTLNVRMKKIFGICLICWEGKNKKVCKFKKDLEKHMLSVHLRRQIPNTVAITL
jgi:Zinc finger, C2H2 type